MIAATTPRGFLLHPPVMLHTATLDVAEVLGHRIVLQQFRVVAHDRDGLVVLRAREQSRGGTHLVGGQLTHFVPVLDERAVQLFEAMDTQLDVGRPVGRVEGLSGRGDGRLGVRHGRIGRVSEHLAGGGVEAGECPAATAFNEPAVDQHPAARGLAAHRVDSDGVGGSHPDLLVEIAIT